MRNQAQLIAYADRFGGSLAGLADLLNGPLAGMFGGVHLLPFFDPIDGADAGFDPIDHLAVDTRVGTWDDVEALSANFDVMADVIVNHISADSSPFQDFLAHPGEAESAGMFLTLDKAFPTGITEADLLRIYRPRPGWPFTSYTFADRSRRILWTTFTPRQIDLDVGDPFTRAYHDEILDTFARHGIRAVRLDAVGYAVKTAGSSCFMTRESFAFIEDLAARARARGIEVLVEVHAHFRHQLEAAATVDRVYDFALPPLMLHALFTGSAARLRRWCAIRPHNAVTVLDTHDGIGIIDVGDDPEDPRQLGLLDRDELGELVQGIHERSRGASRRATGSAAANLDVYQVNCTYFDALGGDDDAYLIARLVQVFLPGIPQIYYVGLLAGHNDTDLLARTGVGRDINRHRYRAPEIDDALTRPVVRRLAALLRLRNRHPAFGGSWELLDGADHEIAMRWRTDGDPTSSASLYVDLRARRYRLVLTDEEGERTIDDLADV